MFKYKTLQECITVSDLNNVRLQHSSNIRTCQILRNILPRRYFIWENQTNTDKYALLVLSNFIKYTGIIYLVRIKIPNISFVIP